MGRGCKLEVGARESRAGFSLLPFTSRLFVLQQILYVTVKQGRKELPQLIDAQSALQDEVALYNFVAGFRLAKGIESELQIGGLYSYTREQEEYTREVLEREMEATSLLPFGSHSWRSVSVRFSSNPPLKFHSED